MRCGEVSSHHPLFLNQLPLLWEGACTWALLLPGTDAHLGCLKSAMLGCSAPVHTFLRHGAKPGGRLGQCPPSLGLPQLGAAPPSTSK